MKNCWNKLLVFSFFLIAISCNIKKDLIRFKDRYGRQDKKYEGKEHTNKINSNLEKFLKPIKNLKNKYLIDNIEIIIEKKKNFTNFSNKDNN